MLIYDDLGVRIINFTERIIIKRENSIELHVQGVTGRRFCSYIFAIRKVFMDARKKVTLKLSFALTESVICKQAR